jgi:hypothetical protein
MASTWRFSRWVLNSVVGDECTLRTISVSCGLQNLKNDIGPFSLGTWVPVQITKRLLISHKYSARSYLSRSNLFWCESAGLALLSSFRKDFCYLLLIKLKAKRFII